MSNPNRWSVGYGSGISGPTTPSVSGPTVRADWPYTVIRCGTETIAIIPAEADESRNPVPRSEERIARLIVAAVRKASK